MTTLLRMSGPSPMARVRAVLTVPARLPAFAGLFFLLGAAPVVAQQAKPAKAAAAATELGFNDMVKLAPVVRMITAEPTTITLRVGQTIPLDSIKVMVVDSLGHVRGRLTGYDFAIRPGEAASAMPRKITGQRAGTTELTVRYPRNAWTARHDPRAEAKVTVVVKP